MISVDHSKCNSFKQSLTELGKGLIFQYKADQNKTILLISVIAISAIVISSSSFAYYFYIYRFSDLVQYSFAFVTLIPSATFFSGSLTLLIFKIKEKAFCIFKNNHYQIENNDDRERILCLVSKDDWNGALQLDRRSTFKKLEKHYEIIFRDVGTLDEVKNALANCSQDKKIKSVWFNVHGCHSGLCLDSDQWIDQNNYLELNFNQAMTEDGFIIIDACNDMLPNDQSNNISNLLAKVSKRSIYAASSTISAESSYVTCYHPLSVKFYVPYAMDKSGFFGKIEKVFFAMLYFLSPDYLKYKFFAKDVTFNPSFETNNV